MTLDDVKSANAEFFDGVVSDACSDEDYEILPDKTGPVLRVTSAMGTRPVYSISPDTLELSYLRHDDDVDILAV